MDGLVAMGRHLHRQRDFLLICGLLVIGMLCLVVAHANPPHRGTARLSKVTHPIRAIDPADTDYRDLAPLGSAIGHARVVLLGEASHRDGSAFLAKTRLIKYLHQQLGFDVLVWEWNFYDCHKFNAALAQGRSCRAVLREVLMSLWSDSKECLALMDYVQQSHRTARPIIQAGLASYFSDDSAFFGDIVDFIRAADPSLPTPEQEQALRSIQQFYQKLNTHRFPASATEPPESCHLEKLIKLMRQDEGGLFQRRYPTREVGFMELALKNLNAHYRYFHRPLSGGGSGDSPIGIQEARNVVFLAQRYFPNRKLMVWCHNGHLARRTPGIEDPSPLRFNETETMGNGVFEALGQEMYSVLFLSHHGEWGFGWQDTRSIPAVSEHSLEAALHATGLAQGFINLRGLPPDHALRARWPASPIAYRQMHADWCQVADGLLFIDHMVASTRMPRRPGGH